MMMMIDDLYPPIYLCNTTGSADGSWLEWCRYDAYCMYPSFHCCWSQHRHACTMCSSGYISAAMLLDELRIAYRGWDTVAIQLDVEARRHKPTIASSVTDEFRAVMEQMKQQQASRSSSGSEASRNSTNNLTSGYSNAVSSSEHLIKTSNHSRVVDTISGTLTTVTSTSVHQASASLPSSSSSSSSIVSTGAVIIQRRLDGTLPAAAAAVGSGFLTMVDEIEDEINSEYGYVTGGGGGSRVDLSRRNSSSSNNNKSQASSSTGSSSKAPPKPSSNAASARTGKGGGAFKPTVGLGASAELRRAYELLMKQQQIKEDC